MAKKVGYWKGKKFNEEHKKKISLAMKGKMPKNINILMKKQVRFKKGYKPWNYIDGRSKVFSTERYGCDWEKIRLLIWKRDNFLCQDCGMTGNEHLRKYGQGLHVHHKVPFLISFDNSLKNLISLCKSCHMKDDRRIAKKLNRGIYHNA